MEKNGLRLLIVDDEEAARYGIRRALETFGCEVAEAASAEAARALLGDKEFDLLLLDGADLTRLPLVERKARLAEHDSYGFFHALGDLVVTGPTRTNVNDYRAILVA